MFTKALILDTETTGIPLFSEIIDGKKVSVAADDPRQPRMCELAAVLKAPDGTDLGRFEALIKPDGWTIPAEITELTGITNELCQDEGRPIAEVMQAFDALLAEADLLVAYSLTFDMKFIRGDLRRLGMADRYGTIPVFDAMRACVNLCKIPPTEKMMATGRKSFKTPNLTEALEILMNRKHDSAHRAMGDVLATSDLFFHLLDLGAVKPSMQPMNKPATEAA